jgi:7,8-dihydropterin-6-yl-methyl-4-(beta-D-ribofuranosyl)aminobenzene 5'-phosphate synthase
MKLTIIVDNRPGNEDCTIEHGLAMYIEHKGTELLYDFGQNDAAYFHNVEVLGIDIDKVKTAVLSHGHYDHTGALTRINGKRIILHPDCFTERYGKLKKYYAGMPVTRDELGRDNELVETASPYALTPDIHFLTSIPRLNDFEAIEFPTMLADGSEDELHDDSAIAFIGDKGLIIIAGCSHSGICNIIEYAKRVTGIDRVQAVIGGFHLREVDANLDRVIAYFKELNADYVITGHCTCDEAIEILREQLGNDCHFDVMGAGKRFNL